MSGLRYYRCSAYVRAPSGKRILVQHPRLIWARTKRCAEHALKAWLKDTQQEAIELFVQDAGPFACAICGDVPWGKHVSGYNLCVRHVSRLALEVATNGWSTEHAFAQLIKERHEIHHTKILEKVS